MITEPSFVADAMFVSVASREEVGGIDSAVRLPGQPVQSLIPHIKVARIGSVHKSVTKHSRNGRNAVRWPGQAKPQRLTPLPVKFQTGGSAGRFGARRPPARGSFPCKRAPRRNLKKKQNGKSHTLRRPTRLATDRPVNPIRYRSNFPVATAAVAGERFEKPKQAHLRRCKGVRSITIGQPGVPGYLTKYKPIQTRERLLAALTARRPTQLGLEHGEM